MMTGKAYSPALRSLLLVTASLYGHIMSMVYDCEIVPTTVNEDHTETTKQFDTLLCLDSCEELKNCSDIMDNIIAEDRELNDDEQRIIQGILVKMQDFRNNLATSKTAQLWFQFLDMMEIMCKSIKAQRTGNWLLHLESVYEMLPYFAASGHYLYAKSAYLYLQKMSKLETSHPVTYRKFKVEGLHVIRRSERYWGGLSSDLIIEQVHMRSMKTSGGLTRGRGMTDIQRTLWLLSSPTCASFNEALQGMTGIQFHTSEQHKESGESRLLKDYNDACIITRYINERTPFVISNDLFSLETGEVADSKVNVYQAKTIGEEILKGMVGIPVLEYSFKKKHMAVIMKSKSTITVDDEVIPVDPQLLFQRLLATAKAKNSLELEEVFHYEMSTVPTSLFGEDFLMRDANKPQLGDAIWKFAGPGAETLPKGCRYVLDGGALLSRIQTWKRGMTFESICQIYKDYVIRHYGNETTVVFDGGYEIPSTKDSEHLRRRKGKLGKQVNFNKQMKLSMKKDDFLLNNSNKQRFLEMLTEIMNDGPLTAMQAPCDADYQIVMTALNLSKTHSVAIIGEDTDLLAITLQHASDENDIFITSAPKSNSTKKNRLWDIKHVRGKIGHENCRYMALVHALLGCDTTSRIQSIGKRLSFLKLISDPMFKVHADAFYKISISSEEIISSGEKLLLMVCGDKEETLDKLRFRKFCQKVASSAGVVAPESLGPTSDAAQFHSLRVYHQVEAWMGNDLSALDWGWYLREDMRLMPIMMSLQPAPQELLKVIRCGCKTDCKGRCTCYKLKLKCTYMCSNCKGVSCLNGQHVDDLMNE